MSTPAHRRRWPASVTVLAVLGLQVLLPARVTAVPAWLMVAAEAALLLPLVIANPVRLTRDEEWAHRLGIALTAILALLNATHLVLLVRVLTEGGAASGGLLVRAALLIWVTNVATAALWFWQLDADGPFARDPGRDAPRPRADLLFPQQTGLPGWDADTWRPAFSDYLFVGFTSATAFSPTDTMPLTFRAKLAFAWTSSIALLVVGVVAARAVSLF